MIVGIVYSRLSKDLRSENTAASVRARSNGNVLLALSVCSALVVFALLASGAAMAEQATPAQYSFNSQYKSSPASKLTLSLGTASVGDRVNYSPNLPMGGYGEAISKPRYSSRMISADWQHREHWSVGGEFARRDFTSLRDAFEFNSYRMEASFRLPAIAEDTVTSLDVSFSSNRSRQLAKNSFTRIGDNLLKSVNVKSPSDLQWQASLSQNRELSRRYSYTMFSGVGRTLSRHDGISGYGIDSSGCSYDFLFHDEGGTVDQRETCGNIESMRRVYPDELSIERELGVAPQRDMQNNAWFYRVGGGLTTRFRRWQGQLAFYHQRYVRDLLDRRIQNLGGEVFDSNNVISLEATHFVTSRFSYTATLEYNQHQFLDDLPILYTRLTSDRFDGDVVHLTLRINYVFSQ